MRRITIRKLKREKIKIEKLLNGFTDVLNKYENCNPEWFLINFSRLIYDAFYSLKTYIENPKDNEVSWNKPLVCLKYPVEIDWKKNELLYLTISSKDSEEVLSNKMSEAFIRIITAYILEALTHDTTPIEDRTLSLPVIKLMIVDKKKKRHYYKGSVIFRVDSLFIDKDKKEGYYPINIGLNFNEVEPFLRESFHKIFNITPEYHPPIKWKARDKKELLEGILQELKKTIPKETFWDIPEALIEVRPKSMTKISLHIEKQKLTPKKSVENKQLMELQKKYPESKDEIQSIGLDLTIPQKRGLFAIQRILDQTDYKGHGSVEVKYGQDETVYSIPLLAITLDQYLEACDIPKIETPTGTKGYRGHEKKRQIKALHELDRKKHKIVYDMGKGMAVRLQPLIIIRDQVRYWEEVAEEDRKRILHHDIPENYDKGVFIIEIEQPLIDQTDSYFGLRDPEFYKKIREQISHGSKFLYTFMEWIDFQRMHRHRDQELRKTVDWTIEINYMELARTIRMDSLIEERHFSRIREVLNECYDLAIKLNYLLKVERDIPGKKRPKDILTLNPDPFTPGIQSK